MTKISIVVPTRNNGNRISGTLRHLFHQTIPSNQYEIIVVDNGSTDNTEEVLSQLKTETVNLRWFKELQTGRAYAQNRGICESFGEVVLFLDDDIEVEENHLQSHLNYHAKSSDPVVVIGRVIDVSQIRPAWAEDYFHKRQVAGSPASIRYNSGIPLGLYFATGNVSLLRITLESIKTDCNGKSYYFDPAFRVRQDGDMGCRLAKKDVRFVFTDDILCWHQHPRSWRSIVDRCYDGGFALAQLIEKHPEIQLIRQRNVTPSILINFGLGVACIGLFGPAFLMRPICPQLLRKVVGALLAYHSNRGFQQALRDRRRNTE